MTEVNLDHPEEYLRLDPDDMFRRVNDLSEQIEDAWRIAASLELPGDYRDARNVVIAGMGGSAIGGSLLEGYAAGDCPVPVAVWRGYGVPAYVNEHSLVIAISYSGNTEETLSALDAARRRGARLLTISTGGELSRHAGEWGLPHVSFNYASPPRATLGYLLTPLLRIFEYLEFLPPQQQPVVESIAVARRARDDWGGDSPEASNEAKQLARALLGKVVVVYGAGYLSAVARRWKTQFNENAKTWASYEEFSELNHNAVVGYEFPAVAASLTDVVMLDGPLLEERIKIRMGVTQSLLDQFGVPWQTAQARGVSRLAHMVSLIALGDYVTYYLALLNGADPTTIAPIDTLKAALARP